MCERLYRENEASKAEAAEWKSKYYDVVDAVCAQSESHEDVCRIARETRAERDRLEEQLALRESNWRETHDRQVGTIRELWEALSDLASFEKLEHGLWLYLNLHWWTRESKKVICRTTKRAQEALAGKQQEQACLFPSLRAECRGKFEQHGQEASRFNLAPETKCEPGCTDCDGSGYCAKTDEHGNDHKVECDNRLNRLVDPVRWLIEWVREEAGPDVSQYKAAEEAEQYYDQIIECVTES